MTDDRFLDNPYDNTNDYIQSAVDYLMTPEQKSSSAHKLRVNKQLLLLDKSDNTGILTSVLNVMTSC